MRTLVAIPAAVAFALLPAQAAAQHVTAADYTAAAGLIETNLRGTVKNETVDPAWIGLDGSFWYRRDEPDGVRYVRFDAKKRTKSPLFDHARLATALDQALGTPGKATPSRLGLQQVTLTADGKTLSGSAGGKALRCDLVGYACTASAAPPVEPGFLPAPDGRRAAVVRKDNLVIKDLATGAETTLTTDGEPYYSYGAMTDLSLITIPRRKAGLVFPPMGATWSPDGRWLLMPRVDERDLPINPFVEWVPQDGSRRPILHAIRSPFTGDREGIRTDLFVFEPATSKRTPIALPSAYAAPGAVALVAEPVGWSVARNQVFLLGRTPGSKALILFRVDLATGTATTVIEERATATRVESNTEEYNVPNIRVIGDGATAIWYSARSGAGQLYRYDAQTGALQNAISAGPGAVFDILAIDEKRREIYFTAGGREPGRDPYYRFLYKASLDRGAPRLLTDTDADHAFPPPRSPMLKILFRATDPAPRIQLDAQVFLDTYSTVSTPPVTVLRSAADGRIIAEIERADASALFATGWKAPVREQVLAADGVTPVFAVYYAPLRPLAGGKHPVIDAEYGGPQVVVAPRNFTEAYGAGNPLAESGLARLGFAIVTVDGRGTPYRDNAFRDAGYPEFTQVGIDDHIAAIRQLATRHPEMDLDRVGIYGWSWGGTFAAQAILSRPEFYRVAVSGAGVYDYAALYPGFDAFTSPAVYSDGTRYRTRKDESPGNWGKLDITALAPRLQGHLLIVYGDLDENVPSSQAFRLAAALVKANKRYDLLYLPGRTHAGGTEGYTIARTWDYFVEHLLGDPLVPDAAVVIKPPVAP